MINSGSTWNKWNFHVHTKKTNKNDQFDAKSMDEFFFLFFKKAFEHKVSAIGITDYFSIDRYLDAVNYRNDLWLKTGPSGEFFTEEESAFINSIFLFPNVELRMLPSTDKKRLINIHCLFNPDIISQLDDDFFSSIENQAHYKMNRNGITAYGASLDRTIVDDAVKYKKGIDNFVITFDSLKQLFQKRTTLRENTILVVSNSSTDGASGVQKHYDLFENDEGTLEGFRKSMYEECHAIFSRDAKDIKYFLGRKSEGSEGYNEEVYKKDVLEVIENRGSLKPCITGCDSHNEATLFDHFTWVKADLSFEGLRQICFEPESRVKIQKSKPDFKEEKLVIESVKFCSATGIFSDNPIFLNPNLNVIIGGKSSGKSILLFAIAKTLSTDISVLKNSSNEYLYNLTDIDPAFDFEVTTKGGFTQKLNRAAEENSILPALKYIPQNHLVKLAEAELNKKGDSLNKIVRGLITEDFDSYAKYEDFLTRVKQNDGLRNTQIDIYFEQIRQQQELTEELKKKSNKEVLLQNIQSNEKQVEELNKSAGLDALQIEEYKGLQVRKEANDIKLQKFQADFSAVQHFADEMVRTIGQLQQKKANVLLNIQLPEINAFYQNEFSQLDKFMEIATKIKADVTLETKDDGLKYFKGGTQFNNVLVEINREKAELDQSLQPFVRNAEAQKRIDLLNQSITSDKASLSEIELLTNRIEQLSKDISKTKFEIFRIYRESYAEYDAIVANLRNRTAELEKEGLKIEGKGVFNFNKFRNNIYRISDGRSASYKSYTMFDEKRKPTDPFDFEKFFSEIQQVFEAFQNGTYVLNKTLKVPDAIKSLLDDYFFDYWDITYKNDKLGQMSTGKASFVILMLIIGLSKSKAPILIDQPEDNLDNRSITSDLVNYLRNKKLERQIIVVTHNANIVVNADAENVIVASQRGQIDANSTSPFKFDYINGPIEHSFDRIEDETDLLQSMGIRQHIADIVEGGKEAFIKREQKYRFR